MSQLRTTPGQFLYRNFVLTSNEQSTNLNAFSLIIADVY